jgi:P4 family phage/plasmid primase-like protien
LTGQPDQQKNLSLDLELAKRFLKRLDSSNDRFTFQILDDDKIRHDISLAQILHGSIDEHAATLSHVNNGLGAGVFVTINETDLKGRTKESIKRVRAVFCDSDGSPIEPIKSFPLAPHFIFETSPGKFHSYWFVEPGLPLDEFEGIQEAVAKQFKGDKAVKDLPRVMRLPGSQHLKGEPFQTKLIEDHSEIPNYSIKTIRETFPSKKLQPIPKTSNEEKIPEGERHRKIKNFCVLLRKVGAEKEDLENKALIFGAERCHPPMVSEDEKKEILNIVDWIIKNVKRGGFALTDIGNGERLQARHGENILYCHEWGSWFIWDGHRFRQDKNGEIIRLAKETSISILDEAKTAYASGDDRAKNIMAHAMKSQGESGLKSMLWSAQSELPVRVDELDQHDNLFNLQNGTLDLKTLTLHEHRRENKLTKLSPVALDGEAKCPLWLNFLDKILAGDKELIAFIQKAVGYSLTGSTEEQVFFLLHGDGANGKSTFIGTIHSLLGDEYSKATNFKTLLKKNNDGAIPNDLAALVGVRFVSAIEVGEGKQLDETVIKQLTGGDIISARFLRQEYFEFRPRFKLWLAANSEPEIRGVDYAIWRRVLLIPFEVTISEEEKDKTLPEKLKNELSGILTWAVEGLRAWRKEGLKPPEKVILATKKYKEDQDIIADFISARCDTGKTEEFFVTAACLTAAYEAWSGGEAVKPKTLARLLKARGYKPGQKKIEKMNQKIWLGLRLKEQGENQHF